MYEGPALTGDVTQLATHCHRVAYRRAYVLASRLGPLTAAHAVASAGVVSRWPFSCYGSRYGMSISELFRRHGSPIAECSRVGAASPSSAMSAWGVTDSTTLCPHRSQTSGCRPHERQMCRRPVSERQIRLMINENDVHVVAHVFDGTVDLGQLLRVRPFTSWQHTTHRDRRGHRFRFLHEKFHLFFNFVGWHISHHFTGAAHDH